MIDDLLAYLHASPTPFHAVAEGRARLEAAGFRALAEAAAWDELGPGKYYVTTSGTNLFAFVLPAAAVARCAYRIIGAHTDSPNLRLKPNAAYVSEGYAQLGVEVYGGALLNSWLDRDLGLAGRVFVRGDGGALVEHLIRIDRPIALSCLDLGPALVLNLPGEPFVEYQLAAQQAQKDRFVCVAGYGDGGPGYIPTDAAFLEGGYEPTVALAAPCEKRLRQALAKLLETSRKR